MKKRAFLCCFVSTSGHIMNLIEGIPAKMAFKALNEKGIYGIKVFSQNNCHTIIIEFI